MYISLTNRLCETPVRKHQSEMGRQQFVENSFIHSFKQLKRPTPNVLDESSTI